MYASAHSLLANALQLINLGLRRHLETAKEILAEEMYPSCQQALMSH